MKITSVAAAKGGVGKSTLVAALATAAGMDAPDRKVGIVDLDPQGSLTRWWNIRRQDRPMLLDAAGLPLAAVVPRLLAAGLEYVFVDCPPGFSEILLGAVSAADLVLVPTRPSDGDLAAVASTVEMARRAGVAYRTVLSAAPFRTRITGKAVRTLRESGDLLWPPIHHRVAIPMAMEAGLTALETQPDGAAARELAELWRGVQAILDAVPGRHRIRRGGLPMGAAWRKTA